MDELVVPDKIGYVTAYRLWEVDSYGYLCSTTSGYRWPAGAPIVAQCLDNYAVHDQTPDFKCVCGIYALKSPYPECSSGDYIGGTVALWGYVVEHEIGYRAEKAYPLSLFTCGHTSMDSLGPIVKAGKIYGIPVLSYCTPRQA